MNWLELVDENKKHFKNYKECRRLCEILEEKRQMSLKLFNSWYSNWFIFFPIFLYKLSEYRKREKVLDVEFDNLHKFLTIKQEINRSK